MTLDNKKLQDWLGRSETNYDTITISPYLLFNAALNSDEQQPRAGEPLRPGSHWLYFLPTTRQSELGPNGNSKVGGFLPPVELPRRMWAGGKLNFHRPLKFGERSKKVSTITSIKPKTGRSGKLVFVTLKYDYYSEDGLALSEEHNIVFREAANLSSASIKPKHKRAPNNALWSEYINPDPRLLFRFSALMFNTAQIHFDHTFATKKEGYPDLIVNARMIVILLLELCRKNNPGKTITSFSYQCLSPLFCNKSFSVNGTPSKNKSSVKLWATDFKDGLSLDANAEFKDI